MTIVTSYPAASGIAADSARVEAAARPASVDYPLGYLRSLDGMRGTITLVVIFAHAGLHERYFPGAMVVMDIFFVMSGYLITSLLLKEFARRGRINFGKFYLRRFGRLYPALATMLAVLLVVSWFVSNDFQARLTEALLAFFYVTNYANVYYGVPMPFTGHLWSLAVEEHFYLVWPLVLSVLLALFGATWRTTMLILCGVVVLALLRAWLAWSGTPWQALYLLSHNRADAFLLGGATALALPLLTLATRPRLCSFLAWSLVPLFVSTALFIHTFPMTAWWYYAGLPLFGAIPTAIALAAIVQPKRTFMHAFYEVAPLVFIGRICYGLYLWHLPVIVVAKMYLGPNGVILVSVPVTFAIATASYYLIERPFMRARPL